MKEPCPSLNSILPIGYWEGAKIGNYSSRKHTISHDCLRFSSEVDCLFLPTFLLTAEPFDQLLSPVQLNFALIDFGFELFLFPLRLLVVSLELRQHIQNLLKSGLFLSELLLGFSEGFLSSLQLLPLRVYN